MSTASWPAARPSPPALAIDRDASLRDYNSFGLPATARTLVHITSDADVRRLLAHPEHGRAPKLVLGGGSNLILSRDPQAVVLRVEVRGRRLVAERPDAWIVEAGATTIAMSQSDAARIGLDLRSGRRGLSNTANGTVPVVMVTLTSVRVGEVEVTNVPAVVMPAQMPHVLLGNSFLSRFQMRRENDVMRLEYRR